MTRRSYNVIRLANRGDQRSDIPATPARTSGTDGLVHAAWHPPLSPRGAVFEYRGGLARGGTTAMICQSCGVEAPTRKVFFVQHIGAIVMFFHRRIGGLFCRNCVNKYFTLKRVPVESNHTLRHARACRGHPRLIASARTKAWMAGTSPAMTKSVIQSDRNML
jgi:hypothetical protein